MELNFVSMKSYKFFVTYHLLIFHFPRDLIIILNYHNNENSGSIQKLIQNNNFISFGLILTLKIFQK
jgi:hypothetical protein